ncbi:hypothetical protein AUC68_00375 [Methyloceanibacter methanicus]|uniref:Lysozyme inhibitor LprI-like N-terminal domain-containing protein n=1 Tax=Methyloceanibacter methanicus TaxID=1774968 RepID=A0A1E3W6G4_9HYPH|nr:lysozyme inhibitor LprI family protein [Methyloceanibacter methanicus]ODS01356.1 hypothetical protein AUC68_00375 [Methyloceanibacter methanicus]
MQIAGWRTPIVATILVLLTSAPAKSGTDVYGPEFKSCPSGSTLQIVDCLNRYTKAWDKRLNAAYQKLLKDNPQAEQLRSAQRLWLKFRDANCGYYGSGDGSIVRIHAAACLRYMTSQRARELEELLTY